MPLCACAHAGEDTFAPDAGSPATSVDAGVDVPLEAAPADTGAPDASTDGSDADACMPHPVRPWEDVGVAAVYVYAQTATVLSGDRYWTLDMNTGLWGTAGHLETVWASIPTVDGQTPWDSPGVATAYPYGTGVTVVSGDRYWHYDFPSGAWNATGHLETAWSGAPMVDALEPWDGVGVRASWVYGTTQTIVSADRYWTYHPTDGTWGATGHLETLWAGAPPVDGHEPWDGAGVRTSYVYGNALVAVSDDRFWTLDLTTGAWGASGHLENVWSTVPAIDACP